MPKDTATSRGRRSRGEGAITELSNGRFRGAIWLPDTDGNMRRKFVRGHTRTEVSRKFTELREQAKGGFPDGTTTGAYLARWPKGVRNEVRAATHRVAAIERVRKHVATLKTLVLDRDEAVAILDYSATLALGR